MAEINVQYLEKCLSSLEKSYDFLQKCEKDSIEYEMYRNSLVKSFELCIEQGGKLLKKRLEPYFATKKALDTLNFKDLFREAGKHSLLEQDEIDRWFKYRDNRNNTAHDYGQFFAEQTIGLIDDFIKDTKNLLKVLQNG